MPLPTSAMEATAADFVQGERPLICFALGNLRQSVVKHILKHVQTKKQIIQYIFTVL